LASSLREAGWPALRHPHSATVVFPKPADHLCQRWQLHVEGGAAHVVVVPRVSRRLLDQFIESLGPAPEFSCDFLPERTDLR
jgi:histidine decarboxylase